MLLGDPGVSAAARVTASPTLAGASIAAAGSWVPSGSVPEPSGSALAEPTPPVRLAVHAADSNASGTIAVALWSRPKVDMVCISPESYWCHGAPSGPTYTSQRALSAPSYVPVSCVPRHISGRLDAPSAVRLPAYATMTR